MTETRRLPPPLAREWDWQLHAACIGLDDSIFFHPSGERGPERTARAARAKQVCARCPVIRECREHALATREPYGVWGGLSEDERRHILQGQRHAQAS